jgi:Amt family ammonium transporter
MKFGYDGSLDVVGVHVVGGLVGTLLLGLFADSSVVGTGRDGLFYGGGAGLLGWQAAAAGAVIVFSFVITSIILLVLKKVLRGGIRVDAEEEESGLDLNEHSETAYAYDRV